MLFSATQTAQIRDLAKLSFQSKPLYVGVDDAQANKTNDRLEQGYVVVPAEKRFLLLFTFLKKNRRKKVSLNMFWPLSVEFANKFTLCAIMQSFRHLPPQPVPAVICAKDRHTLVYAGHGLLLLVQLCQVPL